MAKFNERYKDLTDEEIVERVRKDFGDRAANKLRETGSLTTFEAYSLGRKTLLERGVPAEIIDVLTSAYGSMIAWNAIDSSDIIRISAK